MRTSSVTLFITSLLATTSVLAQAPAAAPPAGSSTAPAAVSPPVQTQESLFPAGTSAGCQTFVTTLNKDPIIQQYTNHIVKPIVNATSNDLTANLDQICAPGSLTDAAIAAYVRTQLSLMGTACIGDMRNEITQKTNGADNSITSLYDVLYLIVPFKQAVCSKDAGTYCVQKIAAAGKQAKKRDLESRQASELENTADKVNDPSTNVAFLYLEPTMNKDILCSQCATNILSTYIHFETTIPYATGLLNSPTFSGQSELYKSVSTTCGKDNMKLINTQANTTAFANAAGLLPTYGLPAVGLTALSALALAL